jgi:hypothetical protein
MNRKTIAALTFSILAIGCGRDLPTSPTSGRHQSPIQEQVNAASGRRRAVTGVRPCVDLSGTWDVHYQGICPTDGYPNIWQLEQTGCAAHTVITPDVPAVSGTIDGSTVRLSMRNGFVACTYQLDGTGTASNGVITAVVSGPVSGPCCQGPNDTVQLVARRR